MNTNVIGFGAWLMERGLQREEWHLDKKVPISIIIAIVCQTLIFVYVGTAWKADVENRLTSLEKSQISAANYGDRILILEQGVLRIREDLAEIKELIRSQNSPTSTTKPKQ